MRESGRCSRYWGRLCYAFCFLRCLPVTLCLHQYSISFPNASCCCRCLACSLTHNQCISLLAPVQDLQREELVVRRGRWPDSRSLHDGVGAARHEHVNAGNSLNCENMQLSSSVFSCLIASLREGQKRPNETKFAVRHRKSML